MRDVGIQTDTARISQRAKASSPSKMPDQPRQKPSPPSQVCIVVKSQGGLGWFWHALESAVGIWFGIWLAWLACLAWVLAFKTRQLGKKKISLRVCINPAI